MKKLARAGFTLIELLIVIAIIGLLSTIAVTALSRARVKARNAVRFADLNTISKALQLFYDKTGTMPANYGPGGACSGSTFWDQSMQELVTAGMLAKIPKPPNNDTGQNGYCYYNYGGGNNIGAIVLTANTEIPPSTTGLPPSCRPWAATTNWCDQALNNYHCICNPFQ